MTASSDLTISDVASELRTRRENVVGLMRSGALQGYDVTPPGAKRKSYRITRHRPSCGSNGISTSGVSPFFQNVDLRTKRTISRQRLFQRRHSRSSKRRQPPETVTSFASCGLVIAQISETTGVPATDRCAQCSPSGAMETQG